MVRMDSHQVWLHAKLLFARTFFSYFRICKTANSNCYSEIAWFTRQHEYWRVPSVIFTNSYKLTKVSK